MTFEVGDTISVVTSGQIGKVIEVRTSDIKNIAECEKTSYVVEVKDDLGQLLKISLRKSYLRRIV